MARRVKEVEETKCIVVVALLFYFKSLVEAELAEKI